ncbi:cyanase [Streptomyces sp. S3(2020)]|uniref:cyanase n=1 Tax=Streptomyces sp. S3(2020) TaxID=2732044 RepID=UPI001488947D|nr:cyanase [Streptomyces sp. S3(2020)]NNN29170.1 cyanase [Streptomyces sp. S3(2020)]
MTDLPQSDLTRRIRLARHAKGVTWAQLAELIGRPPAWTVAALFGQHALSAVEAELVAEALGLSADDALELQLQPYRGTLDGGAPSDPTLYRFYEALSVYGPAIKELIHEEFGDGIMSAINFSLSVERRPDPDGDRVVVTLDGKFLDYRW